MITVGFSTRKHNQPYIDYIQNTVMYKNVEIIEKINNGDKSLSQVYNEIIDESSHDIVVLIHDDLEFDTKNWGDKILKTFQKNNEYGIIGLAGSKYLPETSKWWEVPNTMYGIVNHKHQGKKWTSTYSPHSNSIIDTVLLDGLFLALDKTKIKEKFDETIPGFHFYDLGFTVKNFLSDVKIGVTTSVRVTHLSIGQTNQQWEDNRILFSEKYKNILPIDITKKNRSETFIFCHDQNLILDFEKNQKFKNLNNYTYVFLGYNDIEKIIDLPNLIVARNLKFNIENYPLFTSFTGWYALWKNNLINSDFVNMFEYDVILDNKFEQHHSRFYEKNVEMIGYVPFPMSNMHFINYDRWVEYIIPAIKQIYKFDIKRHFNIILSTNPQSLWSSTSNTTFRKDIFEEYMKWMEPIIPFIKDTETSGHAHERSITFFVHQKKKKQILTKDLLRHLQLDSHKTQGHQVDETESHKLLINNIK